MNRQKIIHLVALLLVTSIISACSGSKVPPEYKYDKYAFNAFVPDKGIAFGDDGNIYNIIDTYEVKKTRETFYNAEVVGKIKQSNFNASQSWKVVLTNDGNLYSVSDSFDGPEGLKQFENVKEFRVGGTGYGDTIFALTNNGDLYGWGENNYGEVGNESPHIVHEPTLILNDVKDYFLVKSIGPNETEPNIGIDDVYYFCAALTNRGQLYTWAPKGSMEGLLVHENNKKVLSLENVSDFRVTNTGIVATLNDGSEKNISDEKQSASAHQSSDNIPSYVAGTWSGVVPYEGDYMGFQFNFTKIDGSEAEGKVTQVDNQGKNPDYTYGVDYRFKASFDPSDNSLIVDWSDGKFKIFLAGEGSAIYHSQYGDVPLSKE
jgi:hypothetical protein